MFSVGSCSIVMYTGSSTYLVIIIWAIKNNLFIYPAQCAYDTIYRLTSGIICVRRSNSIARYCKVIKASCWALPFGNKTRA